MNRYYRLSIAESWRDSESWTINQYYEQPYVVMTTDNSDLKSILKSLKTAGLLKKSVKYQGFTIDWSYDECDIYIERYYADNREPLIIKLNQIDENRLESELNSHYGIMGKPTILCKG